MAALLMSKMGLAMNPNKALWEKGDFTALRHP
jgi:hypothetical protein